MRVFIDTNVLIDVLARREDFAEEACNVIDLGITGAYELCTTSMSFATTVFVAKKVLGYKNAVKALQELEEYIQVVPMDGTQCHEAFFSDMPDFEDMLQFEAAIAAKCDFLVTRNKKHFPQNGIPVVTPSEFLSQL